MSLDVTINLYEFFEKSRGKTQNEKKKKSLENQTK